MILKVIIFIVHKNKNKYFADCNCFPAGTVGGLAVCATTNGQCMCKPNVGSRDCSECIDGKYQLEGGDLFGCKGNTVLIFKS